MAELVLVGPAADLWEAGGGLAVRGSGTSGSCQVLHSVFIEFASQIRTTLAKIPGFSGLLAVYRTPHLEHSKT